MAIHNIKKNKCIGCKKCIDACPMDVLKWNEEYNQLEIAYLADCITCFNCELSCPTKSIFVEPKRARAIVFPW